MQSKVRRLELAGRHSAIIPFRSGLMIQLSSNNFSHLIWYSMRARYSPGPLKPLYLDADHVWPHDKVRVRFLVSYQGSEGSI